MSQTSTTLNKFVFCHHIRALNLSVAVRIMQKFQLYCHSPDNILQDIDELYCQLFLDDKIFLCKKICYKLNYH